MARLVAHPSSFLAVLLLILLGSAAAGTTACTGLCGFVNPTGPQSSGDRGITGCYCDTYCHLHKDCCPDEVSVCEIPTISSISPTTPAPTAGGTLIVISGSYFLQSGCPTGTVTLVSSQGFSAACTIAPNGWTSANSITCSIPPGTGSSTSVGMRVYVTTPACPSQGIASAMNSNQFSFSYAAPTITSFSPASCPSAPTTITITGTNLGTLAAGTTTVSFNGNSIPQSSLTLVSSNTQISFLSSALGGSASSVSVSITVSGQTSVIMTYPIAGPTISSVSPSTGGTAGATTVTVTGTNFGTTPALSFNNNPTTLISSSQTQLTFATPSFYGTQIPITVVANGLTSLVSGVTVFSYSAPTLTSITAPTYTTSGGVSVTLVGTNFYNLASAVVVNWGTSSCPIVSITTVQIVCTMPAGEGASNAISVSVGGQTSGSKNFAYPAPTISTVSPVGSTVPTSGGATLSLTGTNFGASSTVTVGTPGVDCPVTARTGSTGLSCSMPAGQGSNQAVMVRCAAQSSNSMTVSYSAPTITGVSPSGGATSGGATLTITGTNFGTSGTVTVGTVNCPPTGAGFAQTTIYCIVPQGMGSNLAVSVTVSGQSTSRSSSFSYLPPSITSVTPSSGATGGGYAITLAGTSFGQALGSNYGTVTIGSFACSISTWVDTQVVCQAPQGSGSNLAVSLSTVASGSINSQSAPPKASAFSYSAPVITTLSPTTGPTSGFVLTITGSSFDASGSVTLSGTGNGNQVLTCGSPTWSQTVIYCNVPASVGTLFSAKVTAVTNLFSTSTSTFSFTAPVITSMSSLVPTTDGGSTALTLYGTNFGSSSSASTSPVFTIGSNTCTTVSASTSGGSSTATCTVPPGEGKSLLITASVGGQNSPPFGPFNYAPPSIATVSPSSGPTSGNTPITITGTSFSYGTGSAVSVTVGGSACPLVSKSQTQIVCTLPAGQGANKDVVVTVALQSSTVAGGFSYYSPVITGISSLQGYPTGGGVSITVTGTSFSTTGGSVSVGGAQCTPIVSQSDTSIVCTLPAGQGISNAVVVTVSGSSSGAYMLNYNAPTITSLSVSTSGTAGGNPLVVSGTNFGTNALVSIGGAACSTTSQTQSTVTCSIPAGQGTGLSVLVTVSGQVSNSFTFNYNAPSLTSISPNSIPTSGQVPITINGLNFGTLGTVTVGGSVCQPTGTAFAQSTIVCFAPSGQGANPTVVVTVSGQSTSSSALLTYTPPAFAVSSSISPSSGSTAGMYSITLAGSSFGISAASVLVRARTSYPPNAVPPGTVFPSDKACNVTIQTHTQIICTLPAGRGDVNFFLTVAGQAASNNGNPLFQYSAPQITSVSGANPGPTSGALPLTISGDSFDSTGTVTIGGVACPATSYSHTVIVCTLPAGSGSTNVLSVTQSLSFTYTASSTINFAYQAPSLSSISPSTTTTAGGNTAIINGANFGSTGAVVVMFGSSPCPVTARTNVQLSCTIPAGQGASVVVTVSVGGQLSPSTLSISYSPPSIATVSPTTGPTAGGSTIQLTGSNFGLNPSVLIGGVTCPIINNTHVLINCALPAGQGSSLPIQVTVQSQVSTSSITFSYSGPLLNSISPATASTAGAITLTLTGSNFGTNGVVTIGGVSCPATFQNSTMIKCSLQAGEGAGLSVLIYVASSVSNSLPFSYNVPVITSVSPSSGDSQGGTPITVTGTSFGTSGFVTIGGTTCPTVGGVTGNTQIICLVPAGNGLNNPLIVTVAGQVSNSVLFSYNAPLIQLLTPSSNGPTGGGINLVITGTSFGSTGTVLLYNQATSLSTQCPVASGMYSSTSITCQLPPGQGTNIVVVTTGSMNSSYYSNSNNVFSYATPTLSSITPTSGITDGKYSIILSGSNFGVVGVVTISNAVCVPQNAGYSQNRIECAVPAGSGSNLNVVVSSGGVSSAPLLFSYLPPTVTGVTPTQGSSAGSTITLAGTNFGNVSSAISVTINSVACTVQSAAHTSMIVTVPAGSSTAASGSIAVTVSSQTSNQNQVFNFIPPVVTSVSGCTTSNNMATDCSISGGSTITITGTGFGSSASLTSITVGGISCTSVAVRTAFTQLTCALGALPAGGFNLPVAVTYAGQTGSANLLSFAGPTINSGSLALSGSTGSTSLTLPSTYSSGNMPTVVFTGTHFGADASQITVTYGLPLTPTQFPCSSVTVLLSETKLSCVLTSGAVGTGLVFQVKVGVQYSLPGTDTLNYPIPSILPSKLRPDSGTYTPPYIQGTQSSGQYLRFEGSNFGKFPALLSVVFGGNIPCSSITIPTDDTEIRCSIGAGVDGPYTFVVSANNASSAVSADKYAYPASPSVTQVLGCSASNSSTVPADATGKSTVGCPTAGGIILTLRGAHFSSDNSSTSVRVGASLCPIKQVESTSLLYCYLPAGAGYLQSVVVASGAQLFSLAATLLSYAAPTLSTVNGCAATGCPTAGAVTITITGANLGASDAYVLVGANQCTNVVHDSTTPHSKLTCTLPAGYGQSTPILLLQNNGVLSSNVITLNYEQCPIGWAPTSLQGSTSCSQCSPGSYADNPGLPQCKTCQPGYFSATNGSASCTVCSAGLYSSASLGSTACGTCVAGTYSASQAQSTCLQCSPGSAASSGATGCTSCSSGYYASQVQSATCNQCAAGTYSFDVGFSACIAASAGYIVAAAGGTTQTACSSGTYQSLNGQSVCISCPIGTFSSLPGSPTCAACPSGSYGNATGLAACYVCPAGSIAAQVNGNGATTCTNCAVGTYIGAPGQAVCLACAKGTIAASVGSSACTACDAGTFSNILQATTCQSCATGTYTDSTGSNLCLSCPQGFYSNVTGSAACTSCQAGYFVSQTGQSICSACPLGSSVASNGQPQTQCNMCPTGTFADSVGSASCSTCPAGSFAATGASACALCPNGTASAASGQQSCQTCPAGSYSSAPGSQTCTDCPAGYFQPMAGQSSCVACAAGSFSASTQAVQCVQCPVGFSTKGQAAASVCSACAPGSIAKTAGSLSCSNCTAGFYMGSSGQGACLVCPVGSYSDGVGASSCTPCPIGSYQSLAQQTSCLQCPSGAYIGQTGQAACLSCQVGTASPTAGSASCPSCPAGSFAQSAGSQVCTVCAVGFYSSTAGVALCSQCPPGSFSNTTNMTACIPSPVGYYQPSAGATSSVPCPIGTYQPSQGRAQCLPCSVGTYAAQTGLSACPSCPSGSFAGSSSQSASAGATACALCAPGTYSTSNIGSTLVQCAPCDVGSYASSNGASACTPCPTGSFAGGAGQSICTPCGAGTYQDGTGAGQCKGCIAGTSSNSTGLVSCPVCPAGTFSSASASSCSACLAGTANAVSGQTACFACSSGSYSSAIGLSACQICGAGNFTTAIASGATSCSVCMPGSFSNSAGLSTCTTCVIGTYSATISSVSCLSCPPGRSQSQAGASVCVDCSAGYFAQSFGSQSCSACAQGSFSAVAGSANCTQCPVGSAQSSNGMSSCVACVPGTAAPTTGQAACDSCNPGTFAPSSSATQCTPCPAGQSASGTRNLQCFDCQTGKYSNSPGTASCSLCPIGTFSSSPAAVACTSCLAGTAQSNAGSTACVPCTNGTYSTTVGANTCLGCNAGTYSSGPGQSACLNCPSGTFSNLPGQLSCSPCQIGFYSVYSNTGTLQCSPCPIGSFAGSTGLSSCSLCSPGSSQPSTGQSLCTLCTNGTAQPSYGQAACNSCPAGQYGLTKGQAGCLSCPSGTSTNNAVGSSSCSQCDAGKYQPASGQGSCLSCPPGSYSNTPGSTACTSCAAGYFASDPASTSCLQCAAGSYSKAAGAVTCDQTQPGYYQPSTGQTSALSCPPGSAQSELAQTSCAPCPVATSNPLYGQAACAACDAGTYMPQAGNQTSCFPCAVGYNQTAVGQSSCSKCPAGTFNAALGRAQCQACPPGSFQALNGSTSCQSCPIAKAQSLSGQTTCASCQPGSYNPNTGQALCSLCPVKFFSNASGLVSCYPCPIGTYAGAVNQTACTHCEVGTYAPTDTNAACSLCPVGTFANTTGSTSCFPCAIGSYQSSPGQAACALCTPGTYGLATGQQVCLPCDLGNFQNASGQTSCKKCSVGSYAPSTGYSTCPKCLAGTVNSAEGQSFCMPCEPGKFTNLTGQQTCMKCPIGTFADQQGQPACTPCLAGYSNNAEGQSFCQPCAAGSSTNNMTGQISCIPCDAGFAQPLTGQPTCPSCAPGTASTQVGQPQCQQCPFGKYSGVSNTAVLVCLDCPPGTSASQSGASACSNCIPGTYSTQFSTPQCTPCPRGTFVSTYGNTSCAICPVGTYADATGQSLCTPCPIGKFINTTGSVACDTCPPGMTSAAPGSTGCVPCPVGTYSQSGICLPCDTGFYSDQVGSANCQVCSAGTYADVVGLSMCRGCPPGTSTNLQSNLAACMPCAIGQYAAFNGSAECDDCPKGRFMNTTGASICSACTPGHYTLTTGALSCVDCPVGNSASNYGQPDCDACSSGTFANKTGTANCFLCPVGTFQSIRGSTACLQCTPGTASTMPGMTQCPGCSQGSYSPTNGQSVCTFCRPGYFASDAALSSCLPCSSGRYSSALGQSTCTQCAAGTFTEQSNSTICQPCPAGQFAPPGSLLCQTCPMGSYSASGSSACTPCPDRTVAPQPGMGACTLCDSNSLPNSIGTACLCNAGFYAVDWYPATSQCFPCPSGFECSSSGVRISNIMIRAGFWFDRTYLTSFPPGYGWTNLPPALRCTLTSSCNGGLLLPYYNTPTASTSGAWSALDDVSESIAWPVQKTTEWHDVQFLPANVTPATPSVAPAFNVSQCDSILSTAGTLSSGQPQTSTLLCTINNAAPVCPVGSQGPLCGLCIPGYHHGASNFCTSCPSGKVTLVYFGLTAAGIVAAFAVMIYILLRQSSHLMKQEQLKDRLEDEADESTAWNSPDVLPVVDANANWMKKIDSDGTLIVPSDLTYKMKIILTFMQIGSAITTGISIAWPRTLQNTLNSLSFVALDFLGASSMDCVVQTNFYDRFLTMTIVPPFILLIIYVFYLLPKKFGILFKDADVKSEKRSRRRFWKIIFFLLFLIYPSVSGTVLNMFNCSDIYGQYLLRADLSVDCTTTKHQIYSFIAMGCVLLYPIGIPAFLLYWVYKYRYPKGGLPSRLNEPGVMAELGFLYDAYNRDLWYFELVDLTHKLVMTSVIIFFPRGFELITGMAVLISYMCFILLTKPYLRKSDDRLQLLALNELYLFCLTAYSFQTQIDLDNTTDVALSYLLLAIGTAFILFFAVQAYRMIKEEIQTNGWPCARMCRKKRKVKKTEGMEELDSDSDVEFKDDLDIEEEEGAKTATAPATGPVVEAESDDDELNEVDFEAIDTNMSQAARLEMKEAAAQRRAKREARVALKTEQKKKELEAAAKLPATPGSPVRKLPNGIEVEMTSMLNPMMQFAQQAEKLRKEEARLDGLVSEQEPEVFNTPQGKYVKLPAFELSLLRKAEAERRAREEEAEKAAKADEKRNQHPLAGSIKKVPTAMAAPVLLHQQSAVASAASELAVKKEITARTLPKK